MKKILVKSTWILVLGGACMVGAQSPSGYDCSQVPVTMGPEQLEWQKNCQNNETSQEDNLKDFQEEARASYDCSQVPATMGPESLQWQKNCQDMDMNKDNQIVKDVEPVLYESTNEEVVQKQASVIKRLINTILSWFR